MTPTNGLKLISLIPGCGYGDGSCQYAAGLEAIGVPVSWLPVRDDSADLLPRSIATNDIPHPIRSKLEALYNRKIDASAFLLEVPPYRWNDHWLQAEPDLRPYCRVAWETDRLPSQWLNVLNGYERIFVPSNFNKSVFENNGITAPVQVVPHIAREMVPSDTSLNLGQITEEDFVFYTIGAWTTRKNMETTIRAFLDGFTHDDPVALVVKTEVFDQVALGQATPVQRNSSESIRLSTAWALAKILSDYPQPAKVHLISGRICPGQIDQLHQRGDCFISLSHSEGWGLGAFEAALAANPVVITGWGGQLDFLGRDYPLLVDFDLRCTSAYPADGFFLHADDASWAAPRRSHATELMRAVFQSNQSDRRWASTRASALKEQYSAENVCTDLARAMGLQNVRHSR
ncbi:MAG: glycosyltransferase [Halieaceae bacterium]|jgi:glycosyltransferase involved in cell wall biosynthesis|nr:glycosyltransferase [Halieaceae bacterium]